MTMMRRLFTLMAAGALAGAPALAAQVSPPNPFATPRAERQGPRQAHELDGRPRHHRRYLQRHGEWLERHGERLDRRGEHLQYRRHRHHRHDGRI
jgi:hypothetical protein